MSLWYTPLKYGKDLWILTNTLQKKMTKCMWLHKIVAHLARRLSPLPAQERQAASSWAAIWRRPCGKELRVASGWQPAKNWNPQSGSLQGNECCQPPHKLGSGSFPKQGSAEAIVWPIPWLKLCKTKNQRT